MTGRERWLALVAGLAAGFAGGFFGIGGGLVLIPILTAAFGFTQHKAHATSLATIGATALVSVIVYALNHNVAWVTAGLVALTSMVGARWGARLAKRTHARVLARAFAVFLVIVAVRMLWKAPAGNEIVVHPGLRVVFDLALGVAVGLVSGYMGVGGGVIAVPAFTLLLGMPQQLAQGTSLAIILVAAPTGALEHARHGNVVGRMVPGLALGALIAGPIASWLVQGLPQAVLARTFAVLLIVNAVHTWWRTRERPPAPAEGKSGA